MAKYCNITINYKQQRVHLYHGTSDIFNIGAELLPPVYTGNLREGWRKNNKDVVYMTASFASAKKYAKKACEKYGGRPIVFEVKPIGWCSNRTNQEYVAERAKILQKVIA